jgi:D-inositol-3-phosphate glycosyltransferase
MATQAEPLRILFIAPAPRAGTLQYTHNLANALARCGHQVQLATGVDFELADQPRQYRVLEVFDRFRPRPLRIMRLLWRYTTFRPHIVHLQGAQHPVVYIVLWALLRMLGAAQFVYTPQDVLPNALRPYHLRALRFLYARMQHVFVNARQNEALVIDNFHVARSRITVLPIADLTAFVREGVVAEYPKLPEDACLVLCFGLIEPRKGVGTLIAAAPLVLEQIPQARVLIVGQPLMDIAPFERQIAQAGLDERVRLVPGYASFAQMRGYFERARVVVLPYESGWNSGVLASAFGFGKPVVATRVGGLDEVVEDGQSGLLVPPRDPPALAHALVRVLRDDALYAHMIEQVRRVAASISWEQIAGASEGRYRAVLGVSDPASASATQTR